MKTTPAIPPKIKNKNLFLLLKIRKERALMIVNNLILSFFFTETDCNTIKSKLIRWFNGINHSRILNFNLQRIPVLKRDLSNDPFLFNTLKEKN
jgi:hypothetical protein